jgi:hypothetical protein
MEAFMKMLRAWEVYERMGVKRTTFHNNYIKTHRTEWVRDENGRINRLPDTEVDRLLNEDIEISKGLEPAKPAVPEEAYMKGAHTRRRRRAEARA